MNDAQPLRVVSLGGGVQSTAMALMAAEGRFGDVPDCAIFADTGWEPEGVYENLRWLTEVLPYPVHVVAANRSLLEDMEDGVRVNGAPGISVPVFLRAGDGRVGMAGRQCTDHYKVFPIRRKIRDLLSCGLRGRVPARAAELWLGISTDEIQRMKDSGRQWLDHRWPLIDEGVSRYGCRAWFEKRFPGRPLTRSACVGCPFRSSREWLDVRRADPTMWQRTVVLDRNLRNGIGEKAGLEKVAYLHRSGEPLKTAVEADAAALDQNRSLFDSGWGNECSGHCGV